MEGEEELIPGQLVLRKNHVLSNKAEGYHAGQAPGGLKLAGLKPKVAGVLQNKEEVGAWCLGIGSDTSN